MAKSNKSAASNNNVVETASVDVPRNDFAPSVDGIITELHVEAPNANMQALAELTLSKLSDEDLAGLMRGCVEEAKTRREVAANLLPKVGDTVTITKGKWRTKVGTVAKLGKTRLHVTIVGFPIPAYVGIDEVTAGEVAIAETVTG